MPSKFVSNLATVMSQTSLTLPTPFPVSSASLDRPTTSASSASSTTESSTKKSKNIFKKLKEHKDVWWNMSAADRAQYRGVGQSQVVHEWNYMYL